MQRLACIIATFATFFFTSGHAWPQAFPSRPITILVPFPAGGPADTIGRILAEHLRVNLGQAVIIENVGGAAGSIGVARAARAAPDGYTLSLGHWGTHVVNGALYPAAADVLNDFDPVALLVTQPEIIIARKDMVADDLTGLIAWLKANSEKALQGTSGVGSAGHVAGLLFQKLSGTKYEFVPYRGLGPAMQALLAGQVDIIIDIPPSSVPQVLSGAVKAYAVTAKTRLPALPNVPTVDEAGLSGFYASAWYGFWTPKGTPRHVTEKLNAAAVSALADPAIRENLLSLGVEIFPRDQQSPETLGAFHKAEIEKWWPIIKAAKIMVQ